MTKKTTISTEDQVMAHVLAIQALLKVDCIMPTEKNKYAFRIPLQYGSLTEKKELTGKNHFFMSGQVIVYTPKKDAENKAVSDDKKAVKLAKAEASKKAKTVKANASKVRQQAIKTVKQAGQSVEMLERMERLLSAGFTHDQVAKAMDL